MKYERLLETTGTKDEKELRAYLEEIHNYMHKIWADMDISRAISDLKHNNRINQDLRMLLKIYGIDIRRIEFGKIVGEESAYCPMMYFVKDELEKLLNEES